MQRFTNLSKMRSCFSRSLLVLVLLTGSPQLVFAQMAPASIDSATAPRLLVKAGLAPSRILPQSGYYGFQWRVSPSLGLEYRLSPWFSLAGQVEADITPQRPDLYGVERRRPLVPSGAVGLMLRYYYNQAGRIRHQRAQGPFVGNYLALGTTTHAEHYYLAFYNPVSPSYSDVRSRAELTTSANIYWGLQRRVGHHFLYDFNVGTGLATRYYPNSPLVYRSGNLLNFELNLRLYFVR